MQSVLLTYMAHDADMPFSLGILAGATTLSLSFLAFCRCLSFISPFR